MLPNSSRDPDHIRYPVNIEKNPVYNNKQPQHMSEDGFPNIDGVSLGRPIFQRESYECDTSHI